MFADVFPTSVVILTTSGTLFVRAWSYMRLRVDGDLTFVRAWSYMRLRVDGDLTFVRAWSYMRLRQNAAFQCGQIEHIISMPSVEGFIFIICILSPKSQINVINTIHLFNCIIRRNSLTDCAQNKTWYTVLTSDHTAR